MTKSRPGEFEKQLDRAMKLSLDMQYKEESITKNAKTMREINKIITNILQSAPEDVKNEVINWLNGMVNLEFTKTETRRLSFMPNFSLYILELSKLHAKEIGETTIKYAEAVVTNQAQFNEDKMRRHVNNTRDYNIHLNIVTACKESLSKISPSSGNTSSNSVTKPDALNLENERKNESRSLVKLKHAEHVIKSKLRSALNKPGHLAETIRKKFR